MPGSRTTASTLTNNANYYAEFVLTDVCQQPPADRGYEDGTVCPAFPVPVGTGVLIAGGHFEATGTTPLSNLASWNGSAWVSLGGGVLGSLIPTYRLPTQIHTRTGAAKWLWELGNSNPVVMHPKDALEYIEFRDKYGDAPRGLPTNVWREGLKKHGDRVAVETTRGSFAADAVVVAAGSWSGTIGIGPSPPAPVRPVRGQLLHLAPHTAPPIKPARFASRATAMP